MMEFTPYNLLVREAVNGILTLSALLVVAIFARYVWHNRKTLWDNNTYMAATAIMILMTGHFLRSGSSWVEFLLIDVGRDPSHWISITSIWFLMAVTLIITGKILMLNIFAPRAWRRAVIFIGIPSCIAIPVLLALAIG